MPTDPTLNRPDSLSSKPDQRLGRGQRLYSSASIDEAFNGGVRFAGHCMVMWLRRAPDASMRVCVVASKRTFRRAVDRNRAKRLLREGFRRNRFRMHGNVDVVLVARKSVLEEKFTDIESDLMKLADKARLTGNGSATKVTAPHRFVSPRRNP